MPINDNRSAHVLPWLAVLFLSLQISAAPHARLVAMTCECSARIVPDSYSYRVAEPCADQVWKHGVDWTGSLPQVEQRQNTNDCLRLTTLMEQYMKKK